MSWIAYNPLTSAPGKFNWSNLWYVAGLSGIGFVAIQGINNMYRTKPNKDKQMKTLGKANEENTVLLETFNHRAATMENLAKADNASLTREPAVAHTVPVRGEDTEMASQKKVTNRVQRPDQYSVNPTNVWQSEFYGQLDTGKAPKNKAFGAINVAQRARTSLVAPSWVAAQQSVRQEQVRRQQQQRQLIF